MLSGRLTYGQPDFPVTECPCAWGFHCIPNDPSSPAILGAEGVINVLSLHVSLYILECTIFTCINISTLIRQHTCDVLRTSHYELGKQDVFISVHVQLLCAGFL